MKLSEELQELNDCGNVGQAVEGLSEKAKAAEDMLMCFIVDAFSPTGKVSKKTAIKMMKYIAQNNINTFKL
tara:strand:+ start:52 stop:264 length:213 start_codon:yes stop_codon:yes gene_type:complete